MTTSQRTVSFAADDRSFVYAIARRIVGGGADADDVTQNTLLLAYRNRASFRGDSNYRTWLYRIAVTTSLSELRRQRRSPLRLVGSERAHAELELHADSARSACAILQEVEEHASVMRALDDLPPMYRAVLTAREGATEEEVAQQLGITVSNVKIRAHRARKQLRDSIERSSRTAHA